MSLELIVRYCLVAYLTAIVIELVVSRRVKPFLIEVGWLIAVSALALLVNNSATGRVAFGEGTPPFWTVALMFLATLLGIAAHYLYHLERGQFSWLDLVKPLSISPIVLLPLLGTVQGIGADLKEMQVVSFAFLAFQNGFFWRSVLDAARPVTREPSPKPPVVTGGN
jgi:hypothetical protein